MLIFLLKDVQLEKTVFIHKCNPLVAVELQTAVQRKISKLRKLLETYVVLDVEFEEWTVTSLKDFEAEAHLSVLLHEQSVYIWLLMLELLNEGVLPFLLFGLQSALLT